MNRELYVAICSALALLAGGCMVNSLCHSDQDCDPGQRCNTQTFQCFIECRVDQDCYSGGQDVGKDCIDGRCTFVLDQRRPAPEFCLEVVNPRSSYFGQDLCLSQLQGKVVLIYFAQLT